jgi:hypothetical protein
MNLSFNHTVQVAKSLQGPNAMIRIFNPDNPTYPIEIPTDTHEEAEDFLRGFSDSAVDLHKALDQQEREEIIFERKLGLGSFSYFCGYEMLRTREGI